MQGNGYVVGFAVAVCVVCSLLLSGISSALGPRQEENRVLDRQKNILVALGFDQDKVAEMGRDQIQKTYDNNIEEVVVDFSGNVIEGKDPVDMPSKVASGEEVDKEEGLALYMRKDPTDPDEIMAYAYPVTGKGLWSTLYGYMAVKPDGSEIVGLTFYKHGETPGLGAEIEQPWFRKNFVGKEIYEDDQIVGITVVKGLAADQPAYKNSAEHMVDGISGATLTANGVTKMTKVVPRRYDAFFDRLEPGGEPVKEVDKPADDLPGTPVDPGTAHGANEEVPSYGEPAQEVIPDPAAPGTPEVPEAADDEDAPAPEAAEPPPEREPATNKAKGLPAGDAAEEGDEAAEPAPAQGGTP